MEETFYENLRGASPNPPPPYERIQMGRARSPFPSNQRKSPSYHPPEDAWKNYEIQELYDELNRLKRADEAHVRYRQDLEIKWAQSQDLIRDLRGENKLLKEENAQLKMSLHPTPRPLRPRGQNSVELDQALQFEIDAMRKENRELKRVISLPPEEDQNTQILRKYSEMSNEIKTLNVIIQQLNADKTDLIQGRNKIEEESRALKDTAKHQEATLNDLAEHEREFKSELTRLNFQTINLKNENANLNLLLREKF